MTNALTQRNKQTVWRFWQALASARPDQIEPLMASYVQRDISWTGFHPFNTLQGTAEVSARFWQPLLQAFPDLRRDTDIFLGGTWQAREWVAGMGHFSGTFKHDWLGIPATGRATSIRFGEFCALRDDKIVESYLLLDLIEVMQQAGYQVLPPSAGLAGKVPAPSTHDGVLLEAQDDAASSKSLRLVEAMIAGLGRFDQADLRSMQQTTYWHPQMRWYGPAGIGTTVALKGFEDFHQRPFLHAFPDRNGGSHKARIAEGHYVASTGWPSIRATQRGEWLGQPATGQPITMRVADFWRRDGDLLAENWVFIDIVDVFRQLGVDLFDRLREQAGGERRARQQNAC